MKRPLPSFKSISGAIVLLVLLACTNLVSGQQSNLAFRPAKTYQAVPGQSISLPRYHRYDASVTTCDTNVALDYSTYNEIISGNAGITYNGSWNNITGIYAAQLSGLRNRAESDSFQALSYAAVFFDTLAFSNYASGITNSQAYSNSKVTLDSIAFFAGLSGDSTKMTTDSLVITVFGVTNGVASVVKTLVYKGMAQLRQFYLGSGFLKGFTLPASYAFNTGESFAVSMQYLNHDTSAHFILSYSYPDSCGTINYLGGTYNSPAHPGTFPGNSQWGILTDTLTSSVTVNDVNSAYYYSGLVTAGIPLDCSFLYEQNWEIIPIVTVCQTVTVTAPAVVTDAATAITTTGATLNGTVNAEGASSTTGFQYGTTTGYGSTATGVPSPVTGTVVTPVSAVVTGLQPSTLYHFRAFATNTAGTTYGSDLTFTTLAQAASTCDTLFNLTNANDQPYIVTVGVTSDSGWFAGNNFYGMLAYSEGFGVTIGDHISSAMLDFVYANYLNADANKTVTVKIWDNTGTSAYGYAGAPGNAIDSATVTLSQIGSDINNGVYTSVNFTHNVAFTGDTIYVGVVLPTTTGDTIVLANNFQGVDGDGWELEPFTTPAKWASYNNDWGLTGNTGNYIKAIMCAPASSSSCTPTAGAPAGVSPAALQVPCITQGVSYSETYTVVVPTTITAAGTTLTITSITIDSIGNLPSGITWTPGVNPETIAGGSSGCYILSGISNAACGEYLTPIYVTAVTNLGTFPTTLFAAGEKQQFLQIISSGHNCPVVDTAQTATFVADPSCGVTAAPSVTITTTGVLCFGGSTGTATAHATGGNGTYTYLWSNGATTSSITNIAGNYSVTVTSNGQTATASGTITQPASALNVTANATQTSCTGSTGTATAVVTGGTVAYSYHWSNGGTVASLTGLAANTYVLTVTDANGCSATGSATVTIPAGFTANVVTTNVACYGLSTGSATANTTGSAGSLTYNWSNGTTTQTVSNATAGTLNVTVSETNGCSATASGTITQPASALNASASATTTSCASNTGTAMVTANGGTVGTGYTYLWSPGGGSTTTISNLGVGTYTVTVTDAHSCTATASAGVNTTATFTINVTPTAVGCYGASTGSATVSVTGASGTPTYLWNTTATTVSITGLAAGNYSVVVKDGSGCSKTASTTVTQPASALSATVTTTQSACSSNTGTATAAVTGGTSAYTYVWNNASHANPASGFGVGSVTVTVTDANQCSTTASGSVSSPAPPTVNATATAVLCYGQATGSATATVSGSSNDTYFWSNGGTSSTISNVAANTYTVTVTDGFGCSASASATVTQPVSGVTASTSTTPQSSCLTDNGTATVTASNGASPYSYLWSNSGGNATINNLAAGNYSVTVTDNNHCTASATASVNSPASFSIVVTTTNDLCYGASTGSATVTVTGSGNYTYLWSNSITNATNNNLTAGTYGVTVTDGNGCSKASSGIITQPASALVANATATNSTCGTSSGTASVAVVGGTGNPSYLWSNNATTSSISNLGVNVYSVTVTELTCTATASAIVNNINGPTVSMLSTNPSCPQGTDGSASAVANGGTSPYSYTWSNNQTTSGLSALGAGTYSVIVSDHTGCQVAGSVTLTAPAAIVATPAIVNATCAGESDGTVTLTVSGGTPGYSYSWSSGATGGNANGLAAGAVTVTITDSKQCSATGSFTVTQPTALQITTTTTDATVGANGTATAAVSGGTPPYTYQWANSTTATASNLAIGTYTVTVTDGNHCTATATAHIVEAGINNVISNITSITLLPNPASDVVKVVVSLTTAQTVEFRLVDITGKYIYTGHENTIQGTVTHAIDLNQFASGIYLVEVTAGNEVSRQRLVITK